MILVINLCKEKLHYYEFVKPILDILGKNNTNYFVKGYDKFKKEDLDKCSKVIICGTSLFDNDFVKFADKFNWILNFDKPILGICGGMQMIGLLFFGKIKKKTEIGFFKEKFDKEFLGLSGEQEVYHLHNNYVDFGKMRDFDIFAGGGISQAVKHKEKEIYGVLFHPEVRNKKMILNFIKG